MWLLILEALAALALLLFIVWWTMFSGRKPSEPEPGDAEGDGPGEAARRPSRDDSKRP